MVVVVVVCLCNGDAIAVCKYYFFPFFLSFYTQIKGFSYVGVYIYFCGVV